MRKPTINASDGPIDEYIGTAYDVVKAVYDELDHIVTAGDNADTAEQAAQTAVESLQQVSTMYEDFDKRFLGAFTIYPSVDNNGNPLEYSALFYLVGHSTDPEGTYIYGSSGWVPAANTISSAAAAASAEAAAISETNAETSATQANNSATAAASSEQAAQTSETNAGQSATAASTSETNAAVSETNAATSETNAGQSATNAANSETAALQAKNATETLFNQFGDQYLGSLASDPTTDNDGGPLEEGNVYWNTTDNFLKFYTGTTWAAPTDLASKAAANALTSEQNADDSEANALLYRNKAEAWAENPEDIEVDPGRYSSLHHRNKAEDAQVGASTSETNAAASATSASTSASNAALSETNAKASETAAATSETNAAQSETNANSSATSAATSESNAGASENLAQKWANEVEDVEVEPSLYSALHWAAKAEGFASSIIKSVNPTADTVAQRTNDGRLKAAESTEDDDVLVQSQAGSVGVGQLAQYTDAGLSGLGYGGTRVLTGDMNTFDNTQLGYLSSGATNTPVPGGGGFVLCSATDTAKTWLAFGSGGLHFGRIDDGVRSALEAYHNENILGTVSQSGGVPTGAVIEHDSNSDGFYTKYADGTMECWGETNSPVVAGTTSQVITDIYLSPSTPVTFPGAFALVPTVITNARYESVAGGWPYEAVNPSTTGVVLKYLTWDPNASNYLSYYAKGRWYT